MAKDFKARVPQPQDKITNKTKGLPFLLKKEHPRIPRVLVHHNKDIPLPTRRSHTSWVNKVHMEQLAFEGPIRRLERGSEWEPIKILLEGD
jgi:hypothetical protein